MKLDFKTLVSDIAAQDSRWRENAQKAVDYYDHLQVTDKRLRQLQNECGGDAFVGNLIQPAINSVLGHEEQRRVQWMVVADDEDSEEVAEGLNQRLNETMRLCYANRYASDSYKDQIIKGVGWVYMERNPDPFGQPYLIEHVPLSEVFWDMRSRDPGLRDCRWVSRRKFMDVDEACAFFPAEKKLIKQVADGWEGTGDYQIGDEYSQGQYEHRQSEWAGSVSGRNIDHVYQDDPQTRRRRVAVYHVFYRVYEKIRAVRFADGRVVELDKQDLMQAVALATRQARPISGTTEKMRCKWFIGPHEISDGASDHPHNHYPFVPFWGYRKDTANTPYGLVEGMIDPQDAYNEVGFRIYQIIKHKRVHITEEELKSEDGMKVSDYVHEVNREDGVLIEKRAGNVRVEQDWNKLQALRGERELHAQQIRDFSGIYNTYSGQTQSGQSGIAIASAAELGATTLAEINANYQFGRKRLGELALAHIVQDIGRNEVTIRIIGDGAGKVRRTVKLNARRESATFDASQTISGVWAAVGEERLDNDVTMARYQVAMADVASSAGYRQHTHQRVMEMFQVGAGHPVMGPFLMELAVDSSELPNRHELLEKLRKLQGVSDDPDEQAAMQQQAMAAQQQAAQLAQAKVAAEIAENEAQAEREQAHAALYQAQAAAKIVEIEETKRKAKIEEAQQRAVQIVEQRRNDAMLRLESV